MDVNIIAIKDGEQTRPSLDPAPSVVETSDIKVEGSGNKKKRRRGKSKRKIMKPFVKTPWPERRKNDKTKRNNRFRKIVLNKTHAPFNNNQFLMEIHKPEPDNHFNKTPGRTRDSSFSVDSEDNYFYSLPEDEEEYLTKEFSSVYEDAQSERLSNMSKTELIQEYLLLEAKYDNLVKRTERVKPRSVEEDKDIASKDTSITDKDSMMTDRDPAPSYESSSTLDERNIDALLDHVKEQDSQILELQAANEQLRIEIEALRQRTQVTSSEDSESDSSTSSGSSSSSSNCSMSPQPESEIEMNGDLLVETQNSQNGALEETETTYPLVNGFHNPSE